MKTILAILALFMIAFSSCRKDGPRYGGNCTGDCYTFKGRLIEQQTGNGLSGIEVRFYFDKFSSGLGGNGSTQFLGTSITQADGSYKFSIPKKPYIYSRGRLVIAGSIPGYVNQSVNETDHFTAMNIENITDSVINKELKTWKAAPLKIRVVTVTNTGFDQFYFSQLFGSARSYNNQVYGRRAFDTTFNIQTASGIPTYINWRTGNLYGNTGSVSFAGSDTITVASGSSGLIVIQL
jgi:hypothetical protein